MSSSLAIIKEHLQISSRLLLVSSSMIVLGCVSDNSNTAVSDCSKSFDGIEISMEQMDLDKKTGLYKYRDIPFTGIAIRKNNNNNVIESMSLISGKRNGLHSKWFDSGVLSFEVQYTNGLRDGISKTWWVNGNLRSQYSYEKDALQGKQFQYYQSGLPFKELTFVKGKEDGMQKSWRENGKLYNNYEAKNGRIFGLKRADLCFQLDDEKVQVAIP